MNIMRNLRSLASATALTFLAVVATATMTEPVAYGQAPPPPPADPAAVAQAKRLAREVFQAKLAVVKTDLDTVKALEDLTASTAADWPTYIRTLRLPASIAGTFEAVADPSMAKIVIGRLNCELLAKYTGQPYNALCDQSMVRPAVEAKLHQLIDVPGRAPIDINNPGALNAAIYAAEDADVARRSLGSGGGGSSSSSGGRNLTGFVELIANAAIGFDGTSALAGGDLGFKLYPIRWLGLGAYARVAGLGNKSPLALNNRGWGNAGGAGGVAEGLFYNKGKWSVFVDVRMGVLGGSGSSFTFDAGFGARAWVSKNFFLTAKCGYSLVAGGVPQGGRFASDDLGFGNANLFLCGAGLGAGTNN